MSQVKDEGFLTETNLLYYAGKKLGILEKLIKYDSVSPAFENDIESGLDDEFIRDTIDMSFIDKIHYENIKKIITSILFASQNEDPSDRVKEDNLPQNRILKLNDLEK